MTAHSEATERRIIQRPGSQKVTTQRLLDTVTFTWSGSSSLTGRGQENCTSKRSENEEKRLTRLISLQSPSISHGHTQQNKSVCMEQNCAGWPHTLQHRIHRCPQNLLNLITIQLLMKLTCCVFTSLWGVMMHFWVRTWKVKLHFNESSALRWDSRGGLQLRFWSGRLHT